LTGVIGQGLAEVTKYVIRFIIKERSIPVRIQVVIKEMREQKDAN